MTLLEERNQEATVWVGGLDDKVDEDLLWELMTQAGPVVSVNVPRDKITRDHSGYAFVEFKSEEDADYAMKIMNMVRLYGKSLKINKASRDKKETGVGANIFVGNLDPDVDDQAFGQVLSAKVMYEEDGTSRGFGFVNFADFDSADTAISNMNGQFLSNRPVHVSYAYKKEGASGERHGSENERLLAAMQAKNIQKPHQTFATSGNNLYNKLQQQQQLQNKINLNPITTINNNLNSFNTLQQQTQLINNNTLQQQNIFNAQQQLHRFNTPLIMPPPPPRFNTNIIMHPPPPPPPIGHNTRLIMHPPPPPPPNTKLLTNIIPPPPPPPINKLNTNHPPPPPPPPNKN